MSMRRFNEIVEDLELRDLPLQGGVFTWRGELNSQSKSRLDRFLSGKISLWGLSMSRLPCPG